MVIINHDWDTSNPKQEIEEALNGYLKACYGSVDDLHPVQLREVRQAFLSVIYWMNTQYNYDPGEYEKVLRKLLGQ